MESIPEFLVKVDFEIPPTRGIQSTYFDDDETKPDEYYSTTALRGIHPTAIARGITRKVKPEPDSSKGGCS